MIFDIDKNLYSFEHHIKLMNDSVLYINTILTTFYNTEQERLDLERNIHYLQTMLNKDFISEKISEEQSAYILDAIDKAKSILSNNPK